MIRTPLTQLAGGSAALLLCCGWATASQPAGDLPPQVGTRQGGHDWPSLLGPERNGKSAETGLDFDWPPGGPPIVWQQRLGTSYSGPSISRGRLFQFDRYGNDDRLTCYHAETGDELWSISHATDFTDMLGYNNGPRCSPVVDGDRVYTMSAGGILQCVDIASGERRWQIDTTQEFGVVKNFFGVGSTPVIFDDLLIANIGGSPPGEAPDIYAAGGHVAAAGSGVVAFDKHSGEVRWTATNELASYASPVVQTIDDRPWCFVFARGGLVALDPRNGEVDFEYPWRAKLTESVNASTPVVVANEVFLSETYGVGSALLRVRPGGYEVVWKDGPRQRDKAMELHWNTPIHHQGYLYGSSGRHAGTAQLRCVRRRDGQVQWSQPALGRCSILYADGHLVCLSEDGTLYLLKANPKRYELLQQVMLRDQQGNQLIEPDAWTAPVLAHGLLYLRGSDRLVCLELSPR